MKELRRLPAYLEVIDTAKADGADMMVTLLNHVGWNKPDRLLSIYSSTSAVGREAFAALGFPEVGPTHTPVRDVLGRAAQWSADHGHARLSRQVQRFIAVTWPGEVAGSAMMARRSLPLGVASQGVLAKSIDVDETEVAGRAVGALPPAGNSIDRLAALIPEELMDVPGHAFYSGVGAFSGDAPFYLLGLNPGGKHPETVRQQFVSTKSGPPDYSAFRSRTWKGESRIDRNVLHLLRRLSLDPGRVPASCVVFARTRNESDLREEFRRLAQLCWPFHRAVIDTLGVRVVVCFGGSGAAFVRSQLRAHQQIDAFVEQNDRGWTSRTYVGAEGIKVVQLTHPSRADWRNPAADVSPLVKRALDAE